MPTISATTSRAASTPSCSTRNSAVSTSPRLAAALKPERDLQFDYLGLQTLYDRYFLHVRRHAHRAAAGFLHARGDGPGRCARSTARRAAIEFYDLLSSFDFMSSTPTLFNAGTLRPAAVLLLPDHRAGRSRRHLQVDQGQRPARRNMPAGSATTGRRCAALGAHIKGTNGESQGVVPFLKVANDTAIAVNQGGKRKGAVCAYLETWHIDIEEFLDLRKNTGDDRRRTHDMNTANWIPDLFMQRVEADGEWTLFSPDEAPDLHDLYGKAFETAYDGLRGEGRARRADAVQEGARRPICGARC